MTPEEARESLNEKQINDFEMAFKIFDKDDEGEISVDECGRVMKVLGQEPDAEQLAEIVAEVDVDGSGTIDFDEFLIMMVMQMGIGSEEGGKPASEKELADLFRLIDKNSDHYIDWEELKAQVLRADSSVETWEVDCLLQDADKNGDGMIDIEEWRYWMDGVTAKVA